MPQLKSLPLLLGALALLVIGCGTRSDPAAAFAGVRTLSLASVAGTSSPELSSTVSGELEVALRRSLSVRGYQVSDSPGGDAVVRASWVQQGQVQPGGRSEVLLGVSLSIFDRKGARIHSARSVRLIPSGQWNADRVSGEVSALLRGVPEAAGR